MSTKAATKKIVVAGGNGFLGSRICKAAAARGWQVTSISRSGEPTWSSVTSSPVAPTWSSDVNWVSANILQPSTYKQHLENADSVVHSMGILLEADYKGVLTGKEPIISGLQKAFSSTKQGTQNPLERKEGSDVEPQHEGGQITYEVMNRDSAVLLAKEASAAGAESMAYISAAGGAPILPARYIKTKREAEESITSNFPAMRSVFIRPGFLYDSSRTFTVPMAGLTFMGAMANSLVGGRLTWLMGAGGVEPLKADLVAEAVVEALADEQLKGPVEVKTIKELATRAWRRGML
ncbi:NAD(P)-binding protein, partial [Aureobasidium melanogenum]